MIKGRRLKSSDLKGNMKVILVRMDGGEYLIKLTEEILQEAKIDVDNHICEMYETVN